MFSAARTWRAATQGLASLVLLGALTFWLHHTAADAATLRTTLFHALVANIMALIVANRANGHAAAARNPVLWAIAALVAGVLLATQFWPWAGALFGFTRLQWVPAGLAYGSGALLLGITLLGQRWRRWHYRNLNPPAH